MARYLRYLNYVLRHKWFVFLECYKVGLVWRGLIHDWSKFLPSEFVPYANYFGSGIQTGRDKTGYYKPTDTGDEAFDFAWFLHQKRNRHHWQWWVLPDDGGGEKVLSMVEPYRMEMLCDWKGARRAQGTSSVTAWYVMNHRKIRLDPKTMKWIEAELGVTGG